MKIIGIDPGLRFTGWAIINSNYRDRNIFNVIESGIIKTNSTETMATRIYSIHQSLLAILQAHQPQMAAIEETYVNKNYNSSLMLAHARASIILSLKMLGIEPIEYSAKQIKKTLTGNGNADKESIIKMLNLLIPQVAFNRTDESDAIAIALCCHYLK